MNLHKNSSNCNNYKLNSTKPRQFDEKFFYSYQFWLIHCFCCRIFSYHWSRSIFATFSCHNDFLSIDFVKRMSPLCFSTVGIEVIIITNCVVQAEIYERWRRFVAFPSLHSVLWFSPMSALWQAVQLRSSAHEKYRKKTFSTGWCPSMFGIGYVKYFNLMNFFKWNCYVKITRQIDVVLYFFAYDWCNLTNFSSEIAIWK